MTEHITVSRELLRQVLEAMEQRPPFDAGEEIEYDNKKTAAILALRTALEQPAVESSSDLKAKCLGDALFDCIKASKILRDDIHELTVAELLHFAKDLRGHLERKAPQPQQPAVEPFGHVTVRRLSERFENHADQYTFYPAGQVPYLDNVDECVLVFTATPSADAPLLTDDEIYEMYTEPRSDAEMLAFGREVEQAVRQKAGLK